MLAAVPDQFGTANEENLYQEIEGIDSEEYYAAYASIYLGDYYLKQGYKTEAKKFYERALTFKNNKEYTGSINQRAKTGLSRLK